MFLQGYIQTDQQNFSSGTAAYMLKEGITLAEGLGLLCCRRRLQMGGRAGTDKVPSHFPTPPGCLAVAG
jgi:hypothetical protein